MEGEQQKITVQVTNNGLESFEKNLETQTVLIQNVKASLAQLITCLEEITPSNMTGRIFTLIEVMVQKLTLFETSHHEVKEAVDNLKLILASFQPNSSEVMSSTIPQAEAEKLAASTQDMGQEGQQGLLVREGVLEERHRGTLVVRENRDESSEEDDGEDDKQGEGAEDDEDDFKEEGGAEQVGGV